MAQVDSSTTDITVAIIAASATVVVAILSALVAYLSAKRERRRKLYGEATKVALSWVEMLYRVRRRPDDDAAARDLVNMFHSHQEQLIFYQGWIGSESKYMARSFQRLVTSVKSVAEPLITQAWDEEIRPIPGNARPDDEHPDVAAATAAFLSDVRSHLSPLPWRKLALIWRNRGNNG